jgi:hypothetical protein
MKRTKKNNNKNMYKDIKWYLIYDGTNHKIIHDLTDYDALKCVIVEITSQQAAAYLLLKQTYSTD